MADSYLECLTREFEISGAGSGAGPDTVYIGGGTPTVLTENRLQRLMEIVLSAISGKTPAEWSVEVSPDTLSRKKLDILMSAGVNRVSMGAQSFDEQALIAMGRRHNRKQIFDGIETMRKNGMENIGVDLIASIPGVTDKSWRENLNICASLKIPHISVYSLTIEEGTVLRDRIDNGSLAVKNERDQLDDLSAAESILTLVGYRRYEISNYSLPGYECGHNMACWRGDDYAGFGPGASGREGLARWTNVPDLKKYIDAIFSGAEKGRASRKFFPPGMIFERECFSASE